MLAELTANTQPLPRQLDPQQSRQHAPERLASNEVTFRTEMNQDAMATEKLAEGIRVFTADAVKLDELIAKAQGK